MPDDDTRHPARDPEPPRISARTQGIFYLLMLVLAAVFMVLASAFFWTLAYNRLDTVVLPAVLTYGILLNVLGYFILSLINRYIDIRRIYPTIGKSCWWLGRFLPPLAAVFAVVCLLVRFLR